jgi:hypothetical protein
VVYKIKSLRSEIVKTHFNQANIRFFEQVSNFYAMKKLANCASGFYFEISVLERFVIA